MEMSSKLKLCPLAANQGLLHVPEEQLENLPNSQNPTSTERLPIRHALSICSFYCIKLIPLNPC